MYGGADLIIFIIEYPAPGRNKSASEVILHKYVGFVGTSVFSNFYIRAGMYFIIACVCFAGLPLIVCGLILMIAAFIYGYAGYNGETVNKGRR
ncbi:uncharacterized protein AMSG_11880 [Thecamonas trahens ATCC 50062]|uniref:Uncharacterized protein n=1 Tax=Thecamonas trahens ATCC 50062 TaxID=461836 RepID=A0A0L0DAS7_THETB|nr:hypothetical protein AMSG_11880 [Thecamonas trahens ATCC 50062]KNC49442.1 hypothetical protein AMSG_11880 [Thecamonas trahens ATCC 50062]|eukprot:XP_013757921.1 hypothetical protein AMSG_11880 [Thecamonas trahens ATCC 50062]